MAKQVFATKGNLMQSKKSLALAKTGYDLMDRKRNVLVLELMSIVERVKTLRNEITKAYELGYYYLQQANVSAGLITNVVNQVPIDNNIELTFRSVMGIEVPKISYESEPIRIQYGIETSSSTIDEAFIQFNKVKKLTIELAEIDNSVYRLANAIRTTQKRANALRNVVIPNLESTIKRIGEELEEKEREEFSRLKVIKSNKERDLKNV